MAQNYTRQSSFADGDTITAALFNNEFNQVVNAFAYSASSDSSTGHKHDGTSGQGGNIPQIGDIDFLNKIVVDNTNNRWGFYVQVSSGTVEQLRIQDGAIVPVTDNDIDLGTSSLEFKDLFLDGTAHIDTLDVDVNATVAGTLGVTGASTLTGNVTATNDLSVGGNLTVTGNATIAGNLTFGDAATDTVAFSADVASNLLPSADNTYDLGASGSEWKDLYIDGTANIDSLVADTADINGGTIDSAVIGDTTPAAITGTAITATGIMTATGTSVFASLDISGDIDVDGTTNLDVVDIDGAVDMATTLTVAGNVDFNGDLDVDGTTNLDVVDIDGAVDMASTLGVTGVATLASLVATTADINAGTIDGTVIGGATAAAISGTTGQFATSLNVDGTVTADGLIVDGTDTEATVSELLKVRNTTTGEAVTIGLYAKADNDGDGNTGSITFDAGADGAAANNVLRFSADHQTNIKPALSIAGNRDISFYEDTGTTPKLFWDASAEYLGIGTSTPTHALNVVVSDNSGVQIESAAGEKGYLFFGDDASNTVGRIGYDHASDAMDFWTGSVSRMTLNSTGIDVTGSVTADGLTVDGDSEIRSTLDATLNITSTAFTINSDDVYGSLNFVTEDGSVASGRKNAATIQAINAGGSGSYCDLDFYTSAGTGATNTKSLKIAANGDISFYEDTGTTPKLFWDASAESLDLTGAGGLDVNTATGSVNIQAGNASADIALGIGSPSTANKVVVTAGGSVGVGTDSPNTKVELSGARNTSELRLSSTSNDASWTVGDYIGKLSFYSGDQSGAGVGIKGSIATVAASTSGGSTNMVFSVATTSSNEQEAMRLDADGLVFAAVQYTGGFGAQTTSGTESFDDSSNARAGNGHTLLQGSDTGGPGGLAYYHVFNYEYSTKDGTGNMTQLAYGYNTAQAYIRYRFGGTWSSWAALT